MARTAAARAKNDYAEGSVPATKPTKQTWLDLAIEALVTEGIDQVKVQVMAKKLGVSRSGFYWSFATIQDLYDQMLEFWLKRNTGSIIERAMRPAPSVTKAVLNVFESWIDSSLFDPSLDIAVRFWARRDEKVRAVVDEADEQRVNAIKRMFERYGYAEEEALTRARVLYFTQIGHYTLAVKDSMEERMTHLKSYLLTFTGTEPDQKEIENFIRYSATFS